MKILLKLTLLALISWSCQDEIHEEGDLLIRIENLSTFEYTEIKVSDLETLHDFDMLKPGERSEYILFKKAYRYAYVELKINGKAFYIQPIDFVGEELLKPGKHTYQISANSNSDSPYGRLDISLKTD